MVTLGIIGPFIGSVVLAVAYELFRVRLDEDADAGTGTAARGAT